MNNSFFLLLSGNQEFEYWGRRNVEYSFSISVSELLYKMVATSALYRHLSLSIHRIRNNNNSNNKW